MGKVEVFALAVIGLLTVGLVNFSTTPELNTIEMFESWMDMHGKHYDSMAQKAYRHKVWMSNFEYVQKNNAKYMLGEVQHELEMNHFADLTLDEFAATYLMKDFKAPERKQQPYEGPRKSIPDDIDWTTRNAVSNVENQGQCGSCWAFSAVGAMEGLRAIKDKKLESLSVQELVDCSYSYGNKGCAGGLMNNAFHYVQDKGITNQASYPYKGWALPVCHRTADMPQYKIGGYKNITSNNSYALREAVAEQPVSVAIQANQIDFQLYKQGVFVLPCGTNLDHGVVIVGYSVSGKLDYWKVKNSWGPAWGEAGFIRMEITDGPGKCGIQLLPSVPTA